MNLMPLLIINAILFVITVFLYIAEQLLVNYGECKIIVNKDKILKIKGGGYLLGALNSHKIYIPSACGGKATCGHCKVKALTGAGSILPTEEVFIDRNQREEGLRLACQIKIKNDLEIFIPEYLLSAREYRVTVKEIIQLTHDIKEIKLQLEEPDRIDFKPGQYVQFRIPGTEEFRAYSIASPPSQKNMIELIVRLVPGGLCSTYIHQVLNAGDSATITGPFGDFFLREDHDRGVICIGGGCGMAPIRSIIYYLKENNMPRKVCFFFGARSKRDLFFTEELKRIEHDYPKFRYIPALSEPKEDDSWDGEAGLITHVVERHFEDGNNFEAYLCGPPPMIDAAIEILTKKGIKEEDIHFDKF